MLKKTLPVLLGAALMAPLLLSAPAEAQSYDRIQRLEERVQNAKEDGNWRYSQQLRRQLNRERLRYQERRGLGEVRQNPRGFYRNDTRGHYVDEYYSDRDYYDRRRYDRW